MLEKSSPSLTKKLGIKPGWRLLLVNAPDGLLDRLHPLPEDVDFAIDLTIPIDWILFFVTTQKELKSLFANYQNHLQIDGSFWVAWPKKKSKVWTDLSFDFVQELGLQSRLVDNKICAVDETWTALRFVYRKEDRAKLRKK